MGWFRSKSAQEKQVQAAIQVLGNLFEKTTIGGGDAPVVLKFELPDSKLRYSIFCLSTVQMACAPIMTNPDAILNDLAQRIVTATLSEPQLLASNPGTPQNLANRAAEHLEDYLDRWSAYIGVVQGGNTNAATGIVCGMLRSTESDEAATDNDVSRLWPLAVWIERRLPAMAKAFVRMAS